MSQKKDLITNECNLLKQEVICRICLDLYTDPVTLFSCQHTFCLQCFKELFSINKSPKLINCPFCKKPTNRRSYWLNKEIANTVALVKLFDQYISSNKETDHLSQIMNKLDSHFLKFLDDCVNQLENNDIVSFSSDDNDEINTSNSSSHIPDVPKTWKTKPLNCIRKNNNNTKKKEQKKNNDKKKKSNDDFFIIDEDDKKIISLIEDDFLKNIEDEFKENVEEGKENQDLTNSKKRKSSKKKTSTHWTRLKKMKDIGKGKHKFKQLNVSTESNKAKDEILSKLKLEKSDLSTKKKESRRKIDTCNSFFGENDDESLCTNDDIFELQTQKLSTSIPIKMAPDPDLIEILRNETIGEKLNNSTNDFFKKSDIYDVPVIENCNKVDESLIESSPIKSAIVVDVVIHHEPRNRTKSNKNSIEIDYVSATEKSSESIKKPTTGHGKLWEEIQIGDKQNEVRNELEIIDNQKTTVIASFQQSLNYINTVLSECSDFAKSESLFSDVPLSTKKSQMETKSINVQSHSLPILQSNDHISPDFFLTAIPCLKSIKNYYNQIINISESISQEIKTFKDKFSSKNKEIIEVKLGINNNIDVEIQTDILECPNCKHNITFDKNFKSNNIIHDEKKSQEETFSEEVKGISPSSSNFVATNLKKKVKRQLLYSSSDDEDELESKVKRIRTLDSDTESKKSKCDEESDSTVIISTLHKNSEEPVEDSISQYVSILERHYKAAKFNNNLSKLKRKAENSELHYLLDSVSISDFEAENFDGNSESKKIIEEKKDVEENKSSEKTTQEVFSSSMFINESIKNTNAKNNICNLITMYEDNSDVELDKEVANITNNNENIQSDDDIFEDENVVESTPKKLVQKKRGRTNSKSNAQAAISLLDLIEPPQTVPNELSWIDIAPPPPFEFQDLNNVESVHKTPNISPDAADLFSKSHQNLNLLEFDEISKTKHKEESDMLFKTSYKQSNLTCSSQRSDTLNPIVLAQKEKFSPLQIIISSQNNPSPKQILFSTSKQQKSILSFVKPSTNDTASISKVYEKEELLENKISGAMDIKNICVACSRLNKEEILSIMQLKNTLNIKYSKDFSSSVTHLVVATDNQNRVKDHTIKYILAISHSLWIVSPAWVRDSIKQKRILPEEAYEVLDVTGCSGPKISRLTRRINLLLKNYLIHCADLFMTVNKTDLENTIVNLGGEVCSNIRDLINQRGKIRLILSEGKSSHDFHQYQLWRDNFKVLVADVEWLSRSVGQYQITSIRPYLLCSEDGINDLGYPYPLIIPVPESQMTFSVRN